jgi:hypothetical protein
MRASAWRGAIPAVLAAGLLAGCDQDWPTEVADVIVDTMPGADDPGYDPGVDTAPDISADTAVEEAEAPCTYPSGPYAFRRVGDTVAPMAWPAAVPGDDETSPAADLEQFFCDPEVKSVFVLVTNTT